MIDWKVMNSTFSNYNVDEKVDALEFNGQTIGITKNFTHSFYNSFNSETLEYEEYNFDSLDENRLEWDNSLVPTLQFEYRKIFKGSQAFPVKTIFFSGPESKSIYVHGKTKKAAKIKFQLFLLSTKSKSFSIFRLRRLDYVARSWCS